MTRHEHIILWTLMAMLIVAAAVAQISPWLPSGNHLTDTGWLAGTTGAGTPPPADEPPTNNLAVWLDAGWGTLASSGTRIKYWTNRIKTTEGIMATNSAREPDLTASAINGLPAMHFKTSFGMGTNTLAGLNLSHPYTALIVCKRTNDTTGTLFDSFTTQNALRFQYRTTSPLNMTMQNGISMGTNHVDVWYYNYMVFDNGGSGNFTFSTNNGANRVVTGTGLTSAPTGLAVGAQTMDANSPFQGLIAELLIYQGAMGSSDEADLKAYIVSKYNLP